jgi:hypothetical protein
MEKDYRTLKRASASRPSGDRAALAGAMKPRMHFAHRIEMLDAAGAKSGRCRQLRRPYIACRSPSTAAFSAPWIYVSRTEISCTLPQWGQFTFSITFHNALRLCASVLMPVCAC